MAAEGRITATAITPGSVIVVEREPSGTLISTRRKRGSVTVTVTGKDVVKVDGGRQRRYLIHTDGGTTLPVPGVQTFMVGTVPAAEVPAASVDQVDTVPVAEVPTDDASLWDAYQAARAAAEVADGPAPVRLDMRARVETFRGRKLRTQRGTQWGTVRQSVNGQPCSAGNCTGNGSGPEGLDRAAAQLRKDVIAADERRVTDPDAYPAHWYEGAPALTPAVVAYLVRAAEREREDRAALAASKCADWVGHVPGVLGCAPSVKDCNGVPTRAEHITGRPIPEAHSVAECGTDTIGRAIGHALALRHTVSGPVLSGTSDPYGRGDVREFGTWSMTVDGYDVTVVSYTARLNAVMGDHRYAALMVRGRLIDGAGRIPMNQTPAYIGNHVARLFGYWQTDQPPCAECRERWLNDQQPCPECCPGAAGDLVPAAEVLAAPVDQVDTVPAAEAAAEVPAESWAGLVALIAGDDTDGDTDDDGGSARPTVDQGPTGGAVPAAEAPAGDAPGIADTAPVWTLRTLPPGGNPSRADEWRPGAAFTDRDAATLAAYRLGESRHAHGVRVIDAGGTAVVTWHAGTRVWQEWGRHGIDYGPGAGWVERARAAYNGEVYAAVAAAASTDAADRHAWQLVTFDAYNSRATLGEVFDSPDAAERAASRINGRPFNDTVRAYLVRVHAAATAVYRDVTAGAAAAVVIRHGDDNGHDDDSDGGGSARPTLDPVDQGPTGGAAPVDQVDTVLAAEADTEAPYADPGPWFVVSLPAGGDPNRAKEWREATAYAEREEATRAAVDLVAAGTVHGVKVLNGWRKSRVVWQSGMWAEYGRRSDRGWLDRALAAAAEASAASVDQRAEVIPGRLAKVLPVGTCLCDDPTAEKWDGLCGECFAYKMGAEVRMESGGGRAGTIPRRGSSVQQLDSAPVLAAEVPAVPTMEHVPAGLPYVVDMPKDWPTAPERLEAKQVARLLKRDFLPLWFPDVRFSVRTDSGSMYVGADISWTDGPAAQVVDLVAQMWQGKFYDGQNESTSYRGAVLFVNAAGEARAYDLPGISINTHRDITDAASDQARAFLPAGVGDLAHSEFSDPFGRPYYGGSRIECARWMASYGVDQWTRADRLDPRPACQVERCQLVSGHPSAPIHRNEYGRAFLATLPGNGDGGSPDPAPQPDDLPASDGDQLAPVGSFVSWSDVVGWIKGDRPAETESAPALAAVVPAPAAPVDQVDTVPAAVLAAVPGDVVTVRGWSVSFLVTDTDHRHVIGEITDGEIARTPHHMITSVERGEVAASWRAGAPWWTSGKPKAGDRFRAVALHATDGQLLEGADLVAERVVHLGCGCFRLECFRPGPAGGNTPWVAFKTGCGFHECEVIPPAPAADTLARAGELGRQAYADGLTPAAPAMDPDIMAMVKELPVGGGGADIFRAFLAGHAAAADREAERAIYAVTVSEQNAEAAALVAERNPAAQHCADIAAAGAESAARNAMTRVAEAEQARAAVTDVTGVDVDGVRVAVTSRVDLVAEPVTSLDQVRAKIRAKLDAERAEALGAARAAGERSGAAGGSESPTSDPTVRRLISALPVDGDRSAHRAIEDAYRSAYALATTTEPDVQSDTVPAAEAPADVDQGDPVSIYGAPVDWYTPELKSDGPDDATDITIRHDHENGTVMEGGRKGDGTLEIVQPYWFKWRRFAGVHIPVSRDRFADLVSIEKAAEALRAAGHTVTVEIDDVWRPAAVREEARGRRADARVERLAERSGGAYAKAEARRLAARKLVDGMPFGEPIKVGHHSERAHRRAFERIDANDRASYAARDYAEHLASRAAGAESNEAAKHNPRAIMRRIETLEAEGRKWARHLADPATGDGWRRRSTLEAEKITEDIAYQRAKLGDMAAAGAFVAWSGEHFVKGDMVNVGGRWCEVARINRKGVSVRAVYDWHTAKDVSPVKWDQIHGRRRDGMQWDAPNAEPYSVEDAQRAARWRTLVRDTARRESNEPASEIFRRVHVGQALRIVLGLPVDATDAEVRAFGEPDTKEAKRARALACLAVFERLEAGDSTFFLRHSVQPIGDTVPTWTMPDVEPIDVFARELVAGDVINGMYDQMFGGERLVRSFVGPIAGPPVREDRRESGEWYTIRLTTGEETEVKSWRRLSVRRTAPSGAV